MQSDKNHGRAAGHNPQNRFNRNHYALEHIEGIDEEPEDAESRTRIVYDTPKKVVNEVNSPDLPFGYSLNPYQGCEHGCSYCYARPTHQYYGYSAGLDFEQTIIAKKEAPQRLREHLMKKSWHPAGITLSGNTDCYQPLERKLGITRQLLEVFLEFRNPLSIITKNALILRDLDLLKELASMQLVHAVISVTTLDDDLRRKMEPRTATAKQRLRTIRTLTDAGVPCSVLLAPVIPALNSPEIPEILKQTADAGAITAGYTIVRLNPPVDEVFTEWIRREFPLKADKVLSQIAACHGGSLSDSRFGKRMRGEGPVADSIRQLFRINREKYFSGRIFPELRTDLFQRPGDNNQLHLF